MTSDDYHAFQSARQELPASDWDRVTGVWGIYKGFLSDDCKLTVTLTD